MSNTQNIDKNRRMRALTGAGIAIKAQTVPLVCIEAGCKGWMAGVPINFMIYGHIGGGSSILSMKN